MSHRVQRSTLSPLQKMHTPDTYVVAAVLDTKNKTGSYVRGLRDLDVDCALQILRYDESSTPKMASIRIGLVWANAVSDKCFVAFYEPSSHNIIVKRVQ